MIKNKTKTRQLFSIKFGLLLAVINPLLVVVISLPLIIGNLLNLRLIDPVLDNIALFVVFTQLISAIVMLIIIKRRLNATGGSWRDLGLKNFPKWRALGYLLLWPVIAILVVAMAFIVVNLIGLAPSDATTSSNNESRSLALAIGVIPTIILTSMFAPIIEEIAFRGVLFTSLKKRYGLFIGIALSSIIFAVVHLNPIQMITAIVLAPYLCWMYHKLNSIYPGMILHALHNGMVTYLVFSN